MLQFVLEQEAVPPVTSSIYIYYARSNEVRFLVRVLSVSRGELNEGEFGYYYGSYHRTISGIPLQ